MRACVFAKRSEARLPDTAIMTSTERQRGPSLSMLQASVMQPARLTRPNVGRRPVTLHRRLGETMLPSVSLPMANPTSPAATAAAEPADDEERAILRKLPIPIQADALFKTISLTLNTEGDLGKGLETVVMALGGVNGLLVKLQQDKLS